MIEQNAAKPLRKVAISDAVWEAYEQMAREMGTDRDALISVAMQMFARMNGFMGSAAPAPSGKSQVAARPSVREVPPPEADEPLHREPSSAGPRRTAAEPSGADEPRATVPPKLYNTNSEVKPPVPSDDDPRRREVAERVLETAAELERLIKGKASGGASDVAARPSGVSDEPVNGHSKQLFIVAQDGEPDKVLKERFLIGRGKHCDFIINSGKVSREHAVIVRDGPEYFIEDLGSSNGTWFNKQRIKRRKIEDGDEYYICSEKIKCVVR